MYLAYLPTVRCDVMLSPRSECHRPPPPSEGFLWQLHLIIITVIVIVFINVTVILLYHLLIVIPIIIVELLSSTFSGANQNIRNPNYLCHQHFLVKLNQCKSFFVTMM